MLWELLLVKLLEWGASKMHSSNEWISAPYMNKMIILIKKKTVIATFSSWQTCWSMNWNITYVKWKDVKGRKLEGIKLLKPIRVKGKGSFPLVWTIKPALNVPGYYRNLCDGNQNNRIYGSCKCVTKKSTYHQ